MRALRLFRQNVIRSLLMSAGLGVALSTAHTSVQAQIEQDNSSRNNNLSRSNNSSTKPLKIKREADGSMSLYEYNVLTVAQALRENLGTELNIAAGFAENSIVLTANGGAAVDMLALVMHYIGDGYAFEIGAHVGNAGNSAFRKRVSLERARSIEVLLKNNYGVSNTITSTGLENHRPLYSVVGSNVLTNNRITVICRKVKGDTEI